MRQREKPIKEMSPPLPRVSATGRQPKLKHAPHTQQQSKDRPWPPEECLVSTGPSAPGLTGFCSDWTWSSGNQLEEAEWRAEPVSHGCRSCCWTSAHWSALLLCSIYHSRASYSPGGGCIMSLCPVTAKHLSLTPETDDSRQTLEPVICELASPVTVGVFAHCGWCVRMLRVGLWGFVPGTVVGSVVVLKARVAGSDLPCWFSASTCTSYSVFQSRPLSTTYSLMLGRRISGFQSDACFWGKGGGGGGDRH